MNRPKRRRSRSGNQHVPRVDANPREMCFVCARPSKLCHCETIPRVDNQIELLLVQHIRERSHPFNTARMVKAAFQNLRSIVDYPEELPEYDRHLHAMAGLLYPSKNAILLDQLPEMNWPQQLVVLDGTWHQAKRLFKCWPKLKSIPHYRLKPHTPGQYRIRLEPDEFSLSTVEAVVATYQYLEPRLSGLPELLNAFSTMISNQLAHPKANYFRSGSKRTQKVNIPRALVDDYDRLVVAYGEAAPVNLGKWNKKTRRTPVYWVAKRLATGEKFSSTVQSPTPLTEPFLDNLQLGRKPFDSSLTLGEFNKSWRQFFNPDDILVVYNGSTHRLLSTAGFETPNMLELKAINFDPERSYSTLGEMFAAKNINREPVDFCGRAGIRLSNAATLVHFLRQQLAADKA